MRRRTRWRLRILLAITALTFGLYGFVRLDRSFVERLGPVAGGVYDLFNRRDTPPLTTGARRLIVDVTAMGGTASVNVTRKGYFGTLGQTEAAYVTLSGPAFDDAALARLAEKYGERIEGMMLETTAVTDDGLESLGKFPILRSLYVRSFPNRSDKVPARVTDEGLVHLRGLDQLTTLHLGGLPVTDAGLESIAGLPRLTILQLIGTKARGEFLSGMTSLPAFRS